MLDDKFGFEIGGFVHSEVFQILVKRVILLRGSLQTDLGGLTIPLIIFCQEESSSGLSVSEEAPVFGL